ncbi:MAG: anthranilate phosphoribosyltransferase [Alphaproteobacteria bacterium]|nr:anthranilate phosphoribosyltransferase [Alphaproteobacteria bacterium]
MSQLKFLLGQVAGGKRLIESEAEQAFDIMMSGNATPSQMGGFLMALRVRGETVEEITGAARVMRAKMQGLPAPADAIDVVGTGGDATGTLNISTGAALVVAACGVPVAKHGNRALSSKSGAADVLVALGVDIDCDIALIVRGIREANIGFMMAPRHHSAMRNVAGTRVELGTRTIFNLLGPLTNPAGVKRHMLGVFGRDWVEPIVHVLAKLGSTAAWVVHGDGLDEITTTGATYVAELKDGKICTFQITPEEAGLKRAQLADIKGGVGAHNARAIQRLLEGEPGAYRDIVLFNAAAALIVAGKAMNLRDGVQIAARAVDSGAAKATLAKLVEITNSGKSAKPS